MALLMKFVFKFVSVSQQCIEATITYQLVYTVFIGFLVGIHFTHISPQLSVRFSLTNSHSFALALPFTQRLSYFL